MTVPDLIANLDASYQAEVTRRSAVPAQRPAEAQHIWVAFDGEYLSRDLMTPTAAADFAVDHFGYLGHEVTVQDGKIGIRNPRIGSEYRWYRPTSPDRPPLLWFRDGDMSDYSLGEEPGQRYTPEEAAEEMRVLGGVEKVVIRSTTEILAYGGVIPTRWIGVPFTADEIACDDVADMRDAGPVTVTRDQWDAIVALAMSHADGGQGGRIQRTALDMFLVRMVAPTKGRQR